MVRHTTSTVQIFRFHWTLSSSYKRKMMQLPDTILEIIFKYTYAPEPWPWSTASHLCKEATCICTKKKENRYWWL
tara:strand:- start:650 stop:874 length:225 start_codon:yes stop_codon:yes gene_type:complete